MNLLCSLAQNAATNFRVVKQLVVGIFLKTSRFITKQVDLCYK